MSSSTTAGERPLGLDPEGTVHVTHDHHELGFWKKYVFSVDHKVIGIQFLFTGLVMLLFGGLMAMAVRWQLAWPWTEMPIIGKVLFPETGADRRGLMVSRSLR